MRKSIPVLAATAGGIALLANFHTTPEGKLRTVAGDASPTTLEGSPPSPATAPATSTSTGPSVSASTTVTAAPSTRSIDGPDVLTDYGDVQVRIVLRGRSIVDVQALTLPSDRSKSQRISASAGPKLRNEALRAQSAHIDIVSGATYTSEGYIRSLQGAIDAER